MPVQNCVEITQGGLDKLRPCPGTAKESKIGSQTSDPIGGAVILVKNVYHLFSFAGVLEGTLKLAQPIYMCFVDLEKAYDHVSKDHSIPVL